MQNLTSTKTSDIQKNLGITADNVYGKNTANAVKQFQKDNGLTVDGIFGDKTLSAYNNQFGSNNMTGSAVELPKAITADTIKTNPQVQVPTQQVSTQPPVIVNQAQQALNTIPEQPATNFQDNAIAGILKNIQGLSGEQAALAEAQTQAGLPTLKQNLQNINNQILTKQAELAQDDVRLVAGIQKIENKAIPMEFITGQQQSIQRDARIARALKASEIGVLNASALVAQGNIELAQDTAQQAVNVKYAPYKQAIATYQAQLEAIKPLLDREEKVRAGEQTIKIEKAKKSIDQLSDFQTKSLQNALSNNAPQSVLNKINTAQSIEDISKVGGQYIVSEADKLDLALKRAQLNKLNIESTGKNAKSLNTTEYSKFTTNTNYKTIRDGSLFKRALEDYKNTVQKYGTGEIISGTGKGTLGGSYQALVGAIKDYYNLGTLDNGVEKLVELGVPKPSTKNILVRDKRVIGSLDKQLEQVDNSVKNSITQLQNSPYGSSLEFQTLVQSTGPKNQSLDDYLNAVSEATSGTTDIYSVYNVTN